MDYCRPGMCVDECLPVVRDISENPCFTGSLRDQSMLNMATHWNKTIQLAYYEFWYRVDSCIDRIHKAEPCVNIQTNTNAASTTTYLMSLLMAAVLMVFL